MKQLFLFITGIVLSSHAFAQTVYLADTNLITDIGYGGAPASCKTNGMSYNSVNMDKTHGTWVADVFTVPASATWIFDTVILYGYQNGSGLVSPFTACNLVIASGVPGPGATVVWGDTGANILSSSSFTGIYKVDTISSTGGLMSTSRPIMYLRLYLSPAPHLTAGTYWLLWSATCATTTSSATTPYKVLPGRINPVGQMSRIYASGSWQYVIDNGDTVGLNKIIKASPGLAVEPVKNNTANILSQNTPNPFRNTTIISYNLPQSGYAKLAVYNMLGQPVATLADGNATKGEHTVNFSASGLPNGAYYYKLSTSQGTVSKQMLVVR